MKLTIEVSKEETNRWIEQIMNQVIEYINSNIDAKEFIGKYLEDKDAADKLRPDNRKT